VFCCPSIYEPFGLVNLEAMACGAAVVASAVGGIPEIVVEDETGFLVDWDEARPEAFEARLAARLTEVLEDQALGERLGRAGRTRVLERFTWPRIAERTVEVYRQLLGGAPPG
jgi:starch synthase